MQAALVFLIFASAGGPATGLPLADRVEQEPAIDREKGCWIRLGSPGLAEPLSSPLERIGKLKKFPNLLCHIYDAPQPRGARIQAWARAERLKKAGR